MQILSTELATVYIAFPHENGIDREDLFDFDPRNISIIPKLKRRKSLDAWRKVTQIVSFSNL